MSESFEAIADVEVGPDEARQLADRLVAWLVAEGIVGAQQTDCVLIGQGYPPGPNYARATGGTPPNDTMLNGVAVDTTRQVYYSLETEAVTCRFCGTRTEVQDGSGGYNEAWRRLSDLIQTWYDTGAGTQPCTGCGRELTLNDWDWSPYEWGFGYLGLTFWNGPGLDPEFVAEVGRVLGHRVVCTGAKL